jgi:hypothetical protein
MMYCINFHVNILSLFSSKYEKKFVIVDFSERTTYPVIIINYLLYYCYSNSQLLKI